MPANGLRSRDRQGAGGAEHLDVTAKESGQLAAGEIGGPVRVPSGFKVKQLSKKP